MSEYQIDVISFKLADFPHQLCIEAFNNQLQSVIHATASRPEIADCNYQKQTCSQGGQIRTKGNEQKEIMPALLPCKEHALGQWRKEDCDKEARAAF